ncbi:MAG: hypothetical protein HUJ90_04250 [Bacteroidales bacterium]|nr:hypothetical protein [Bacteroidales bacterium]
MGWSCEMELRDRVVGWSYEVELWDGVVGWSCEMELWDGVVGWSCEMELWGWYCGDGITEMSPSQPSHRGEPPLVLPALRR